MGDAVKRAIRRELRDPTRDRIGIAKIERRNTMTASGDGGNRMIQPVEIATSENDLTAQAPKQDSGRLAYS